MTAWLGEMNTDAKNVFFLLVTILLYFLGAQQIRDTRYQTFFLVFPQNILNIFQSLS